MHYITVFKSCPSSAENFYYLLFVVNLGAQGAGDKGQSLAFDNPSINLEHLTGRDPHFHTKKSPGAYKKSKYFVAGHVI